MKKEGLKGSSLNKDCSTWNSSRGVENPCFSTRQELFHGELGNVALKVRQQESQVRSELGEDLAARATRTDWIPGVGDNGNGPKVPRTGSHG